MRFGNVALVLRGCLAFTNKSKSFLRNVYTVVE